MITVLRAFIFLAFAVFGQQLHAQVYGGVVAGLSDARSSEENIPEFESDVGFRVFLGNELSEKFAFEVAYVDFGSYEVNSLDGEPDALELEDSLSVYGADISIVGKIPLRSYLSVYARLGVFSWEGERYILANSEDLSMLEETIIVTEGVDPNFGLGFEYQFMDHLGLNLEVNQYMTDDVFHAIYGLGMYFTF